MHLRYLALAVPFAVAACAEGPIQQAPVRLAARAAPETVDVARGEIVIAGPDGYCIDKRGSRLRGAAPFALLASCASVSGDEQAASPAFPALLTVSVDQKTGESINPSDLLPILISEDGRAALARDGNASSVTILEAIEANGAALLRLDDQSVDPTPELESVYWRGLFTLNGRLITTTVVGFDNRPLENANGLNQLVAFVNAIQKASPIMLETPAPSATPLPRSGLFRTLFR